MKRILFINVYLLIVIGLVFADSSGRSELTVTVKLIEKIEGQLSIGLYNSETDWTDTEKVYRGVNIKIIRDTVTYTFEDLLPGTYAVSLYHDENSNNELDRGLFKIPKEGYAFSNNVFGSFGPPDFAAASFQLNGKKAIEIEMHY